MSVAHTRVRPKRAIVCHPLILPIDFKIDSEHESTSKPQETRASRPENCCVCACEETREHVCRTYIRYPVTRTCKTSYGCPVGDVAETRRKEESKCHCVLDHGRFVHRRSRPTSRENISVVAVRFPRLTNTTWLAYEF